MIAKANRQRTKGMRTVLRWLASLMLLISLHAFAQSAGTVTYVYTDPQGTPLAEADASGNITATFEYTPYGTFAPAGTSNPGQDPKGPGYTGHVNDPETNLVYMQARYYDPVTGHFISVDPSSPDPANAFNFNRYSYANNSPNNNVDPNGRETNAAFSNLNRGVVYPQGAPRTTAEKVIAGATGALMIVPLAAAAPSAIPGLLGTSTSTAATSTVVAAAPSAEATALAAATDASAAAQAAGATSGATSGLVTQTGEVFTGASTNAGGPGMATNSIVQDALDNVPSELRSAYHGCCGEINAMSKAANSGAKLEGSVVATVRAAGKQAGQIMKACSTCQAVAEKLGVTVSQSTP